jgi:hypothetical protein
VDFLHQFSSPVVPKVDRLVPQGAFGRLLAGFGLHEQADQGF